MITNKPPYAGALVMKENEKGLWMYLNHPEREPITTEQLRFLQSGSATKWILITYAKPNEN